MMMMMMMMMDVGDGNDDEEMMMTTRRRSQRDDDDDDDDDDDTVEGMSNVFKYTSSFLNNLLRAFFLFFLSFFLFSPSGLNVQTLLSILHSQ